MTLNEIEGQLRAIHAELTTRMNNVRERPGEDPEAFDEEYGDALDRAYDNLDHIIGMLRGN